MTGTELIATERQRQIEVEGWTPDHDAQHMDKSIARAALCYLKAYTIPSLYKASYWKGWPWHIQWWKPSEDPIRNLVKAGALIAAEIDRLSASAPEAPKPEAKPNCGTCGGTGTFTTWCSNFENPVISRTCFRCNGTGSATGEAR